ncbi:OmpA family protein [bacterium SCSIO 12741]|nr:OmpA family protein [bacterium SCSIO 12741]
MRITFLILFLSFLSSHLYAQKFSLASHEVSPGSVCSLYDIRFQLGRDSLLPGQSQLDSLVGFLLNNSVLSIELGVHTDFRGDDDRNLKLSQKRAESIKTYLTAQGVSANRIKPIGFGENQPIIEHKEWEVLIEKHRCGYSGRTNRRVTVVIL